MIAVEAQCALLMLQRKACKTSTTYWLERYERALDECSRNPLRTNPAAHQVRSALANAKKRIDDRGKLAPCLPLDELTTAGYDASADESHTAVIDILHWLKSTPRLTVEQRALLCALARGEDAESLAARANVPITRMRQRISRTRAAAYAAWLHDDCC